MRTLCTMTGFAALKARQMARRQALRLGLQRPDRLDHKALAPPDSQLAKDAEALAAEAYPPHLAGHAYRTWALARAVSLHLGATVDVEVLYVATLLHDVGLTATHAGPEPFEVRGAAVAHQACCAAHVAPGRASLCRDAVALHTSLRAAMGPPEVRLVQSGSGGDLVGLDTELVHPDTLRAIQARWPKSTAFVPQILQDLTEHTQAHPGSPGHTLLRAGFAREVRMYHRPGTI